MQKQMIEKAADAVALDNTELACAFVQKTAMEKAVPDMDKRLAEVVVLYFSGLAVQVHKLFRVSERVE